MRQQKQIRATVVANDDVVVRRRLAELQADPDDLAQCGPPDDGGGWKR